MSVPEDVDRLASRGNPLFHSKEDDIMLILMHMLLSACCSALLIRTLPGLSPNV